MEFPPDRRRLAVSVVIPADNSQVRSDVKRGAEAGGDTLIAKAAEERSWPHRRKACV